MLLVPSLWLISRSTRNVLISLQVHSIHVWEEETFHLFETISDGCYLIRGFTNRDIRNVLGRRESEPAKERNRISRELRKLRAHGLIRKIPHTRRYLVTDKGRRIIGALIETRKRIYPELAAS